MKRNRAGIFSFFSISMVLLMLLLIVHSCKKEEPLFKQFDYSYYPLKIGSWVSYRVIEITIDKTTDYYDTAIYDIKEIIADEFLDLENNKAFRIERYIDCDTTNGWEIKDVWYAYSEKDKIEKVEENVKYIKIVFPSEIGKTWDGNAYNTYDEEEYEIVDTDQADTIGGMYFDSVLTVVQYENENLIEKQYKAEKYAKNVGMIYKIVMDINSLQATVGIPVEQRIDRGFIMTQVVTAYGYIE